MELHHTKYSEWEPNEPKTIYLLENGHNKKTSQQTKYGSGLIE